MNSAKTLQSLDQLIESEGGLHFSAYITNHFGAPTIREQLLEAIKVASEDIRPVLKRGERKKFLKPLDALIADSKTIDSIKGNIGIFRSKDFFRILHVPIDVEEYSTVASSFHVKPLLKWAQEDSPFRLITVSETMSCFYLGTLHSLRNIGTFTPTNASRLKSLTRFSSLCRKKSKDKKLENLTDLLAWLEERTTKRSNSSAPPLFVVGSRDVQTFLRERLPHSDLRIMDEASPRDLATAVAKIRTLLRQEAEERVRDKLRDFKVAQALDQTEANLHNIAKAAKHGLVKELVVAADRKLFGKLARNSGKLTLHPADIDHEDDDVLDDIAQAVVRRGGEVIVAPSQKIPGQHALLAITEPEDPHVHQHKSINETRYRSYFVRPTLDGVRL